MTSLSSSSPIYRSLGTQPVRTGYAFKSKDYSDEGIPLVRQANLSSGNVDISTAVRLPYDYLDRYPDYVIGKDDVLIGLSGAIGKLSVYPHDTLALQNQRTGLLSFYSRPVRSYVRHYFALIENHLSSMGKGIAVQNISPKDIESLTIPLPPLNEQRRIVEKIEELFTKLDAGVQSLKQTQALLRSYRRSVLKAAVEGELSREWREAHRDELESASGLLEGILQERRETWECEELAKLSAKGKAPKNDKWKLKYKPPFDVRRQDLHSLPSSWCWLNLDAIAFVTKLAGFEYTKYVKYDEDGDLPVIKAENASSQGFIQTDFSYVKAETVMHLVRSRLQPDDVLMVFVGAGIGKVARVPNDRQYFLGPNIALIRVESSYVMPKYLEMYLRSSVGFNLTLSLSKATAQGSISMGSIRLIPCAVPSVEEQRFIVEEVERRLSVVDKLEATVEANLKQAEGLRQSILKQAFSGELVPQDPDDEPASMLLERIRAERQTTKLKVRKSSTRPTTRPTNSNHAEQRGLF